MASNNEPKPWTVPDFNDGQPREERENLLNYHFATAEPDELDEDESAPPMLTVEELEQLRADAVAEGLAEGREQGVAEGMEQGRSEGYAVGLEQGQADGFAKGAAAGEQFVQQQAERWAQLNDKLQQPLSLLDTEVEHQLVALTAALAKAVIKVELKTNREIILAAIQEAVSVLPFNQHSVLMYIHPGDIEMIKQYYPDEVLNERGWTLLAEPSLEPGQLRVETEQSGVSIEPMARLETLLENYLAQRARTPAAALNTDQVAPPTPDESPTTDEALADENLTASTPPDDTVPSSDPSASDNDDTAG